MPEASVDEDRDAAAGEDDVGGASKFWERPIMDPIAKALGVQKPSDQYLRKGVAGPLTTHPTARRSVSLRPSDGQSCSVSIASDDKVLTENVDVV